MKVMLQQKYGYSVYLSKNNLLMLFKLFSNQSKVAKSFFDDDDSLSMEKYPKLNFSEILLMYYRTFILNLS